MKLPIKTTILLFLSLAFSNRTFSETITLEQVIRETCAKSDSAKMMRETMNKSDQQIREKWSAALPVISASVFGGRSYGQGLALTSGSATPSFPDSILNKSVTFGVLQNMFGGLSQSSETPLYNSSIKITQPIYTFGKVGTAINIANQFDKSVHLSNTRNMQQLQLLALDVYYRTLLSEMAFKISERSLARKKELYDFLDRNFKAGSGNKAQVLAALADLKNQWSDMITSRQTVGAAKMNLSSLLGRSLTDSIELDTAATMPEMLTVPMPATQDAVKSALVQRGDLGALAYLEKANFGGAKIYNAMYLPSIAATGSFGTQGTKPEDLYNWDSRTWTVGIGLQWTLFDGFSNSASARQYQSDGRKLEIVHDAFSKMIEIEVRTCLAECTAADSNQTAAQEALAAATESYALTNNNFKQGSGQLADLQLAEERLHQAEMGGMNAHYRLIRSRAALQVAMGNDIVKLEDK
ncbi:MAG: TolC family protein [Chitinivibrionales bacterium]|nr:TolC family protein [Chitinivibrionales bacterium]